jgi:hypothetical protein
MEIVVIDANLLLLLIVGSTDVAYIDAHRRLRHDYTKTDFDLLCQVISLFDEIALLPHTLTEVSNLARQISPPARNRIQAKLADFIEATGEMPMSSIDGARREEFVSFGLTDAVILHCCSVDMEGVAFTLLTADRPLATQAEMHGYEVFHFEQFKDAGSF